ncbi:hypothetical protein Hanom_Chr16g01445531 [Helianthus anomalus]
MIILIVEPREHVPERRRIIEMWSSILETRVLKGRKSSKGKHPSGAKIYVLPCRERIISVHLIMSNSKTLNKLYRK